MTPVTSLPAARLISLSEEKESAAWQLIDFSGVHLLQLKADSRYGLQREIFWIRQYEKRVCEQQKKKKHSGMENLFNTPSDTSASFGWKYL